MDGNCGTMNLNEAGRALREWMLPRVPVAVAFSGGVDSALLAKAAAMADAPRGTRSVAVMAVAPTLSAEDVRVAREVAGEIGMPLYEVATHEMEIPEFLGNGTERCYYCKRHRFSEIVRYLQTAFKPFSVGQAPTLLLDGENADDAAAFRPGRRAAVELGIASPLAGLGIGKDTVRALAKLWGVSVANRPSAPCLATRIAYGIPLDVDALRRIETVESFLKSKGFAVCRVRMDVPGVARIEIASADIPRILDPVLWKKIATAAREAGFTVVSLDMEGFASGKMDRLRS